jgi:hypothetical protein
MENGARRLPAKPNPIDGWNNPQAWADSLA